MLIQKELKKMLFELHESVRSKIFLSGEDVALGASEDCSQFSITTPIYVGSNYIPKSVRLGITRSPSFNRKKSIKTSFIIDEEKFSIFLSYIGATEAHDKASFAHLLEELFLLARKWRNYLDEQDKRDHVYIPVK